MRTAIRLVVASAIVASVSIVWSALDAPDPVVVAAEANPPISDSCGTNVTLVLDASGSVGQRHRGNRVDGVKAVHDAGEAFLDALADTGSTARVLQFATFSEELAAQAEVTAASLQPGGAFRAAISQYYNPKPPRPSGVDIYTRARRGGGWRVSNSSSNNQYTNWDASLRQARDPQADPTELVVYITDGDPTAYDFDKTGDPGDPGPPPDVAIDGSSTSATGLARAIEEADAIKAGGTRMLVVGVGAALQNSSSQQRLSDISGPQTVTDSTIGNIDSINDVDVALVQDFDRLARFLRSVVSELCSPSLSIRKLAQSPGSADYAPSPGWDVTVTPTVTGGTYGWILPDTDPAQTPLCGNPTNPNDQAPRTCATNTQGLANFQWEPDPSDAATSATIVESLQSGYTAGRPADVDYRCNVKDIDGNVTIEQGELTNAGFQLDIDAQDIITCSIYNSFDYAPAITLDKADAPDEVRGDLGPPANTVTSTFTVTNTGNAVLDHVQLSDDRCTPALDTATDVNGDGRMGPGEVWTYTCTRDLTGSPGAGPVTVPNAAEVTATDPRGVHVTDTATDTVTVYAPGLELTKSASPTEVEVFDPPAATGVTYTYVATNTGNMTLENVGVTDDGTLSGANATCSTVTPASVTLAPGASQNFTCTTDLTPTDPTDRFVNIATATGTPVFPDGTPAPPNVTAPATAVVTAFEPGIDLVKTADQQTVAPFTDVTYTYVVTNTGTVGIERVAAAPPGSADPRDDWIDDSSGPTGTCAPVLYQSGDTNGDEVLDPTEIWTYQCTTQLDDSSTEVINTAIVPGQTVGTPTPEPLTATDTVTVAVLDPRISIEKSAVRPVVLDPAAPAVVGPDVPTRRPAEYVYTVANGGNVPLTNVQLIDTIEGRFPDGCAPINGPLFGDAGGDGVMSPGEQWEFRCAVTAPPLSKGDADASWSGNASDPAPVTNSVSATSNGPGNSVVEPPNAATATVQVISPSIELEKTPCVSDGAGGLSCDPDPNDADDFSVRPGEDVTYRYEVTNTGDALVRPVEIVDDRCAGFTLVGGDTDGDGYITPGATPEVWEYTCTAAVGFPSPVTNNARVLVVGPLGNTYEATDTARVRVYQPAIDLVKTVSDVLVPVGSTVTYTFEVTNAATSPADGVPADLVLSDILLLDATTPPNPGCDSPTFTGGDGNGNDILDIDPLETWTYECTGVIDQETFDVAGVRGTDVGGGFVTDFDVAVVVPYVTGIDVVKTADPTQLIAPGGPVTYTYEVTNTGNVPIADVASQITDDTCNSPTYVDGDIDGNDLLTSDGDLFETGTAEIWTFECTMDITADTTNVVTVTGQPVDPNTQPPTPLGPPINGTDTATVRVLSRSLDIAKTSTAGSEVSPGDVIDYEMTVTNDGQTPWDAGQPAAITDDLSDVLDDATYNGDAVASSTNPDDGSVTVTDTPVANAELTWEGPLEPGQSVTITYSVTVDEPPTSPGGDGLITNTVTGPPESNCVTGAETGCTTTVPVNAVDIEKTADAGPTVSRGDTINYEVTITNTGAVDYTVGAPAVVVDDLTDVLDDGTIQSSSASAGALNIAGGTATWTGALSAGDSVTITYAVEVNDPGTGNGVLTNSVTGPPASNCVSGTEPGCTTTTAIRALRIEKSAAPPAVGPDGVVTYTIEVENTGGFAYSVADPAAITDDLDADGLLDYASFVGNSESASIGTVEYSAPDLSWEGPLLPGDTATITFQLQVLGDASIPDYDTPLVNTVVGPPESNCPTGTADPDCTATVDILEPGLTIVKSASTDSSFPGDQVTYTILVSNTGQVGIDDIDVVDDLSDVLDDATYDTSSAQASTANGAVTDALAVVEAPLQDAALTWTGDLPVGAAVAITYSVTVADRGVLADGATLNNAVTGPPESNCPTPGAADECTTTTPIHQLTIEKTSSPPDEILPGDRLTYTIEITNTGSADYSATEPALVSDDLSDVLDDADPAPASIVLDPDQGAFAFGGGIGLWGGPLASGETVRVSFDVIVADPVRGNGSLVNTIVGPPESNCPGTTPVDPLCTTTNPIRSLQIAKTSDRSVSVRPGDVISYEVTVTNTGQVAYPAATITDDLSLVLDDATLDSASSSSTNADDGSITVTETPVADAELMWTGPLDPGDVVTITYSVIVGDPNDPAFTGNGIVTNSVTGPPESNCAVGNEPGCRTSVLVQSMSIEKTSSAGGSVLPGDQIDYTVTITNTGRVPYPGTAPDWAVVTDDLSAVLDDATVVPGSASASLGTLTISGTTATWQGPLPLGVPVFLEYSVEVNDPVTGDGVVTNAVTGPPESNCDAGTEPGCSTTVPVKSLVIEKTAAPTAVAPGGVVTYTLEIENAGGYEYTDLDPAIVTDDLDADGVLDFADYVANSETATTGTVSFDGTTLSWSAPTTAQSPWGQGATATVTFQVQVRTDPDVDGGQLVNTVTGPSESNCPTGSPGPGCTVTVPVLQRGLTVSKTSQPDTAFPGDQVVYTLVISNTGQVAIDDVTFVDDLSDVLDDATYDAGSAQANTANGAVTDDLTVVEAPLPDAALTWTGDLPVGGAVAVTYSVTVDAPPGGNGELVNVVTGPPSSNCSAGATPTPDECTTTTPIHQLTVVKTADPAAPTAVQPGDTIHYELEITNTGAAAYTATDPAVVTDDLAGVLDDASLDPASISIVPDQGAFAVAGTTGTWTGSLAVGATVTVGFDVVVDDPVGGDGSAVNLVVGPPESNCSSGSGDPQCTTTTPIRSLQIVKTSDAGATVLPGQLVSYQVVVTNTGSVAYDAIAPAVVTDDLTDVLDDAAVVSSSATAGSASVAGTTATWTGPLAPGSSATITVEVQVNDPVTGDGVLTNAVTGPPESNCDAGTEPGCTTTVPVRSLVIEKSVAPRAVAPGGVATYTVTVENTGGYAYTSADPATFTDDLAADGLLTYASFVPNSATASLGTAQYSAPTLSWEGALAPGQTATVTFQLQALDQFSIPDFDTDLANTVVGPPESNCAPGSNDPACTATVDVLEPGLTIVKSTDPIMAFPGDQVRYTILITNTGETPEYGVSITDDIAGVLDDAAYNGDVAAALSLASTTTLAVDDGTPGSETLVWSGDIAVGGTVRVTYSVTVDARDALAPGATLLNVVTGPPESNCAVADLNCLTATPIHQLTVAKTATPPSTSTVVPGDRIRYSVVIENTGTAPYTAVDPAVVTDDLSDVFDDATADPSSLSITPPVGGFSVVGATGTWTGPLTVGTSVTIEFDVVVDDQVAGDGRLLNTIVGPPESNCRNQSPTPQECTTDHPVQALRIVKASDAGASVIPGQVVTYSVEVTNTGQVPYAAASFTDDLSAVLDDATYNGDAAVSSTNADAGSAVVNDPPGELVWSGPLDPGEVATITYSVTVGDPDAVGFTGDGVLTNAVTGPPESNCDTGTEAGCTTTVPIRALEIVKTSDTGAAVTAGRIVRYEVAITNTGAIAYTTGSPAVVTDDLSGVLDDAAYRGDAAVAPSGAGAVSFDAATRTLRWAGPLAPGATVTVRYSVSVRDPNAQQTSGNRRLDNVVTGPRESNCAAGSATSAVSSALAATAADCRTSVLVRAMRIVKSVDTTAAGPGDRVRYTIRVTNTGGVAYTAGAPAALVDDLSGVLDDASFGRDATASAGTVRFNRPRLSWSGPLAVGATATIRYSVVVFDPLRGDRVIENSVASQTPGANCRQANTGCLVRTRVSQTPPVTTPPTAGTVTPRTTASPPIGPLPGTGSDSGVLVVIAVGLLLSGLVLVRIRRAR